MSWVQRTEHRPLAESPSEEYRYCLDALIDMIYDVEWTRACYVDIPLRDSGEQSQLMRLLGYDLEAAKDHAAELAGRLFDRYIGEEERQLRGVYKGVFTEWHGELAILRYVPGDEAVLAQFDNLERFGPQSVLKLALGWTPFLFSDWHILP